MYSELCLRKAFKRHRDTAYRNTLNHFIEVDKDEDGNAYLVIHTGSRHLGKEVAKYYQNLAVSRVFEPNKNPAFLAKKQAMI